MNTLSRKFFTNVFKKEPKNRLVVTVKENGDTTVTGDTTNDEMKTDFARLQVTIANFIIEENNISVNEYLDVLEEALLTVRGEENERD